MKISKQAFITAWENQRLVRGALKSAGVRPDYPGYEDFLQEGILLYAEALANSGQEPRAEVDYRSFRKIIWRTVDRLRQDQRQVQLELKAAQVPSQETGCNWDNYLTLKQEIPRLAPVELTIFYQNLLLGQPITALAQETGLNRRQLQRIKRKLLEHLRAILTN